MATAGWRSTRALKEQLQDAAYRFSFYQAVRLLVLANQGGVREEKAHADQHLDDYVRFTTELGPNFPASSIQTNEQAVGELPVVKVAKFGVAGIYGPLPAPYTEMAYASVMAGDHSLNAFLDIFNHHLLQLRYAVRRATQLALLETDPRDSTREANLLQLMGLGSEVFKKRSALPDHYLAYYSGMLSKRQRGLPVIRAMLQSYCACVVEIQSLYGAWQDVADEDHCHLGSLSGTNNQLGASSRLGRRVWDQAACVQITLGPITHDKALDLLPNGQLYAGLVSCIRYLSQGDWDARIRLQVHSATIDPLHLRNANRHSAYALGRNAWLASKLGFSQAVLTQVFSIGGWDNEKL